MNKNNKQSIITTVLTNIVLYLYLLLSNSYSLPEQHKNKESDPIMKIVLVIFKRNNEEDNDKKEEDNDKKISKRQNE